MFSELRNLYVMIVFQVSLNFDPAKKNTENTMLDLYLNEESHYCKGKKKRQ